VAQELFFRHALLPSGWAAGVRITHAGGLITAIETGAEPTSDCHQIALPGMPNLHSHTFQRAIAGLTEIRGDTTDSFWTWRDQMYRFALRMNPDEIEAVATQAFIEMLEGGFTSVAEFHYLHHAPNGSPYADIAELSVRIAAAAATAGIDLTLLPVFYAHSGFGAAPPAPEQRRFINDLDSYHRILARCETLAPIGVAPHSLRAVTPVQLAALIDLARGRPIHIHIAEQTAEVTDCLAWSGMKPAEWLLRYAPVGPNWCLIHATQTDAGELAAIAAAGAAIGLCPITEANLGDGIFPAPDYHGAYGIGTDSNVQISVAEELRMLEYSQRLRARARNVMASPDTRATAAALYQNAAAGGSQALATAGGLKVGTPANIVSITGETPDAALAQRVFCGRALVDTVWVRGIPRVSNGRHPLRDQASRRFQAAIRNCTH